MATTRLYAPDERLAALGRRLSTRPEGGPGRIVDSAAVDKEVIRALNTYIAEGGRVDRATRDAMTGGGVLQRTRVLDQLNAYRTFTRIAPLESAELIPDAPPYRGGILAQLAETGDPAATAIIYGRDGHVAAERAGDNDAAILRARGHAVGAGRAAPRGEPPDSIEAFRRVVTHAYRTMPLAIARGIHDRYVHDASLGWIDRPKPVTGWNVEVPAAIVRTHADRGWPIDDEPDAEPLTAGETPAPHRMVGATRFAAAVGAVARAEGSRLARGLGFRLPVPFDYDEEGLTDSERTHRDNINRYLTAIARVKSGLGAAGWDTGDIVEQTGADTIRPRPAAPADEPDSPLARRPGR